MMKIILVVLKINPKMQNEVALDLFFYFLPINNWSPPCQDYPIYLYFEILFGEKLHEAWKFCSCPGRTCRIGQCSF